MSFLERLNADMKQALKNKDKQKLSLIRMLKSALQNEQIKKGQELSDDDTLAVLSREMKQRKESLREFEKAGRDDLVQQVQDEINVLQTYLPEPLSETELKTLIAQTIDEIQASSKKDMGKVMSTLMPKVKGRAEGQLVQQLVIEELSK